MCVCNGEEGGGENKQSYITADDGGVVRGYRQTPTQRERERETEIHAHTERIHTHIPTPTHG